MSRLGLILAVAGLGLALALLASQDLAAVGALLAGAGFGMTRRRRRRRRVVGWSFHWQFAAWIAGALEIWVALWALGHPVGWTESLATEALIQAISSAAFLVPGALGLQEAGFLGLGALLGLPPGVAAALAVTPRIRDLMLYLPGLVAWVGAERRLAG